MLNYIWLALIFIGIAVAFGTDVVNQSTDKFRNGKELSVEIISDEFSVENPNQLNQINLKISALSFNKFYDEKVSDDLNQTVKTVFDSAANNYRIYFTLKDNAPKIWKTIAKISGEKNDISGILKINSVGDSLTVSRGSIILEEVSFAKMKDVTGAAFDSATTAVNIALGLIGIMALWLGMMKIADEAGLIKKIAKVVRPITKFLFPSVPHDHPAIGSIVMNISANMLGLGNAATPFGLKAMEELDKLNDEKGTATNAMCMFLAINTAGFTLVPATAIAIRAAAGSSNPAIIIGTALFGSFCSTLMGILSVKTFEKFSTAEFSFTQFLKSNYLKLFAALFVLSLVIILAVTGIFKTVFAYINPDTIKSILQIVSIIAIPLIIFSFATYAIFKKVKIYEMFVEGAKEGFNIAIRIIPYLVAMLVAIGIFRAGGGMEILTYLISPVTNLIGFPAEAIPMALMRPLSGSGSLGIMAEIISVHGADSFIGVLVSTIMGCTETTFYVIALYFGSVNIRRTRYALAAGLLADTAGILASLLIVRLMFGLL